MGKSLGEMLRLVAWLDHARWHSENIMMSGLLERDSFKNLQSDQKILVHWLCYITDRMRPFEEVWVRGGQIFSEVVASYVSPHVQSEEQLMREIFSRSEGFLEAPSRKAKIDLFKSKKKEDFPKFGARYADDLYLIARTLTILLDYDKSIVEFLKQKEDFRVDCDDNLGKVAYLLYLLTYKNPKSSFPNFEVGRTEKFLKDVARHKKKLKDDLSEGYKEWCKNGRFKAKRLWAALRDYVKPGSPLEDDFLRYFGDQRRYLQHPSKLFYLELPGDVWNNRFFDQLLKPIIESEKREDSGKILKGNASRMMRQLFKTLTPEEIDEYYPEQFDVSFEFSPRMCEKNLEKFCLFRNKAAQEMCLKSQFTQTPVDDLKKRYCPVTLVSCGYIFKCVPEDCAAAEGISDDLCKGCGP